MTRVSDEEQVSRSTPVAGRRWRGVAVGSLLGAFIALVVLDLGLDSIWHGGIATLVLTGFVFGAILGATRLRAILWAIALFALASLLLIGFTPLTAHLLRANERSDPLRRAPAVVVLGCNWHTDGTLSSGALDRIIKAYDILRGGYAGELVLTTGGPGEADSPGPVVRKQMAVYGWNYPIDELWPVYDTHDEAVKVAELAKKRGWSEVILVTAPWHIRRSAAVFEGAGVHVIATPCSESSYDYGGLAHARDRWTGFGNWFHEVVGYAVYRSRGWIR